jgi:lipopolysaccharide/colanic/teichoic acid biosynthesis glycosyltransferase
MLRSNPRRLLLLAALLDAGGQLAILMIVMLVPFLTGLPVTALTLHGQHGWLIGSMLLYLFLGWLFGSYTVLLRRHVPSLLLLQRLLLTTLVTVLFLAACRWMLNPDEMVWLVNRRVQLVWMLLLTLWSLVIRIGFRRGLLLPSTSALLLLGSGPESEAVMQAWKAVPAWKQLQVVSWSELDQILNAARGPIMVATTASHLMTTDGGGVLVKLEEQDPRRLELVSPLRLLELQQERLPPGLIPEPWLSYREIPWVSQFSVQAQLKRSADLVFATLLLVVTSPILLIAVMLIWAQDRGPVFYVQTRSGWLGQPYRVFKLRTMQVAPPDTPAQWTSCADIRITPIGLWLRRFRVDELPQLFNVIFGTMSLIGPRPERPEHEKELEVQIPHYRKRHWMRPGLSGWAQVCSPYAASVEDAELKLSYDLFYIKHFSTAFDLLILFKTIKTVLKAGGR